MKIKYLEFLSIVMLYSIKFLHANRMRNSQVEIEEKPLEKNKKIEGKMNIDGECYNTVCDCDPHIQQRQQSNLICDPSKLTIHVERQGQGGSLDDIKNIIGNFNDLTYVDVQNTSFKCLDGRNSKSVLGTPGGDAGEFILALSAYEAFLVKSQTLGQEDIDSILSNYLNIIPYDKFYMCTDDMAISHLERELSVFSLKNYI